MKLLLGGSPCTHWSIAQTRNRETQPEGMGWELFRNYLIARGRYRPDFFLYENNKSMAPAIRGQITTELGVEPILINSALVSAQNRQRLYWTNIPGVQQPEDRGIILRDILESGLPLREKGYTLKASYPKANAVNALDSSHFPSTMAIEPVNITADGKSGCLRAVCYKDGIRNLVGNQVDRKSCVAVPIRVRDGTQTKLYTIPSMRVSEATVQGYAIIPPGECVDLSHPGSKTRRGRFMGDKSNCLMTACNYYQYCGTVDRPIYQVHNGQIMIGDREYPIKLVDGCYIIRKLTVRECMRLQTVPEDFIFPVSDTQAYKMLGNGWTVDVIAHILSFCPGISSEPLDVLSMYDGMSCGRLALNKLRADIRRYYATEIDKYAIKTTQENFPDTIQLGDAFGVREDEWWSFLWKKKADRNER